MTIIAPSFMKLLSVANTNQIEWINEWQYCKSPYSGLLYFIDNSFLYIDPAYFG